jgi:hypothetical protein
MILTAVVASDGKPCTGRPFQLPVPDRTDSVLSGIGRLHPFESGGEILAIFRISPESGILIEVLGVVS